MAAVILAAGESRRMGQPKQALAFGTSTLLRLAAGAAGDAGCHSVFVVVGAGRDSLASEVFGMDVQVVENSEWRQGMGTSIRCGVEAVAATEHGDQGVLLMVADQPLVDSQALRRLMDAAKTGEHRIVAAEYAGTTGVPAWFARSMFSTLLALSPAKGAQGIIRDPRFNAYSVAIPEAELDIDTPEDYRRALLTLPFAQESVLDGFGKSNLKSKSAGVCGYRHCDRVGGQFGNAS